MFSKRIPGYYAFLSSIATAIVSCGAIFFIFHSNINQPKMITATAGTDNCVTHRVRLHGFKYIAPTLFSENSCESPELEPLRDEVLNYISGQQTAGMISNASVYIRLLGSTKWTDINPDEQYHPASLLKLPVLFTFARMADVDPSILKKMVFFDKHNATLPKPMFPSKELIPGHSYTVKDLLEYMISYSDNDALMLLYNYHDPSVYNKVFSDLGLQVPSNERDKTSANVIQFSRFLRVLYNGTYLSASSSEYALSLLAESDFKQGLLKNLPGDLKVAHKFGEYFDANGCELHETAIFYKGDNAYELTVMTKGKDMDALSNVLGTISKMVYDNLSPTL